jgi:hypothetical protein
VRFPRLCGPIGRDTFIPPQGDCRESGHKAIKKALGAIAKSAPKDLFYGLVARLAGILPTKPPHQDDSREFGFKAVEKALGANAKSGRMGLSKPLRPDWPRYFPPSLPPRGFKRIWPKGRRKGPSGQCEKWPQGPFLRPCGPIGWDTSHQASPPRGFWIIGPQDRGKGPWSQIYVLVARLAGIPPPQEDSRESGQKAIKRLLGPLPKVAGRAFSMYRLDPCCGHLIRNHTF